MIEAFIPGALGFELDADDGGYDASIRAPLDFVDGDRELFVEVHVALRILAFGVGRIVASRRERSVDHAYADVPIERLLNVGAKH